MTSKPQQFLSSVQEDAAKTLNYLTERMGDENNARAENADIMERILNHAQTLLSNSADVYLSYWNERPLWTSLITCQLGFALLPIVLFTSFVVTLTITTAIVGSLFILFWVCFAFVVLMGAISFTAFLAAGTWILLVLVYGLTQKSRHVLGKRGASSRGTVKNGKFEARKNGSNEPLPDEQEVPQAA